MRMKYKNKYKTFHGYANKRLRKLNLNEELKKMELRGPIIRLMKIGKQKFVGKRADYLGQALLKTNMKTAWSYW
jgi:hypothetical protein